MTSRTGGHFGSAGRDKRTSMAGRHISCTMNNALEHAHARKCFNKILPMARYMHNFRTLLIGGRTRGDEKGRATENIVTSRGVSGTAPRIQIS